MVSLTVGNALLFAIRSAEKLASNRTIAAAEHPLERRIAVDHAHHVSAENGGDPCRSGGERHKIELRVGAQRLQAPPADARGC